MDIKKILGEQTMIGMVGQNILEKEMSQELAVLIDQLKMNIDRESSLVNSTIDSLSKILTPYQGAILMLKHFSFYRDKLTSFQVLNNIWRTIENNTLNEEKKKN